MVLFILGCIVAAIVLDRIFSIPKIDSKLTLVQCSRCHKYARALVWDSGGPACSDCARESS
jgi:hypothetical protein